MYSPPGSLDAATDALLFNAARSRNVREVIRPALERGAVVICDRFGDSTRAYQGYGGGVPLERLEQIIGLATDGLVPRRTVLVDVSVEDGLARRRAGETRGLTRFETDATAHGPDFHARVRKGYLEMAAADPVRWRVVDGAQDQDSVAEAIWSAVADLFEDRAAGGLGARGDEDRAAAAALGLGQGTAGRIEQLAAAGTVDGVDDRADADAYRLAVLLLEH